MRTEKLGGFRTQIYVIMLYHQNTPNNYSLIIANYEFEYLFFYQTHFWWQVASQASALIRRTLY
jgi:hypothetical protein